jgi:DNA-binding response OmpR family regulator
MGMKYLAVDSDIELAESEAAVWEAERGIGMDRVDTMTDAIDKLRNNDYLYVGINSDAVNYMPFLFAMRYMTSVPILIATKNFRTENEVDALLKGADLYARFHETTNCNIASVLAHITRLAMRTKAPHQQSKTIVYKDLLVVPFQRSVFVGNDKRDLTRQEFDLLYALMSNPGKAMSYNQIYEQVWRGEYDGAARDTLWASIKRLRDKLRVNPAGIEFIETVRDFGYRFPPENHKKCK